MAVLRLVMIESMPLKYFSWKNPTQYIQAAGKSATQKHDESASESCLFNPLSLRIDL